jgi:hypothetical protein
MVTLYVATVWSPPPAAAAPSSSGDASRASNSELHHFSKSSSAAHSHTHMLCNRTHRECQATPSETSHLLANVPTMPALMCLLQPRSAAPTLCTLLRRAWLRHCALRPTCAAATSRVQDCAACALSQLQDPTNKLASCLRLTNVVIVIAITTWADCCCSQRLHVLMHALADCIEMLVLLVAQTKHTIVHTLRQVRRTAEGRCAGQWPQVST